jgi:hypothetical protein
MNTLNVYLWTIHKPRHHFTIQEWFEIKKCPKCGKANDVMRKFCRACGASLIVLEEEPKPEPVEELEEILADEPEVETPSPPEDEPLVRPSDLASTPKDERLVRPSEVASEQVEMESDARETYEEMEETPFSKVVRTEPEEEEVSESSEMDLEKGREVVKDILEKVKAAEARSRDEEVTTISEIDSEVPVEEPPAEIEEPIVYEEPAVEAEEPADDELEPPPPEEPEPEPVPEIPPSVSMAVDEPTKDEKIRVFESDIKAFNIEREQLQSELDSLRTRLDEEVERYLVVAETKRSRAESLERELKLAKNEYSDAKKEHKNAENRRKKELSNAEKRIQDVDKRIKKAEEGKKKRIRDLEKERLKREEEARS